MGQFSLKLSGLPGSHLSGNQHMWMLNSKRNAISIALLCSLITPSAAQSPSSRNQKTIQAPSTQPAKPPGSNQRGTDEIPLTVKILPTETSKEKTDREDRERSQSAEKAAVDKRLADQTQRLADETGELSSYTNWLAWFTLFLFCAAVV